MNEISAWEVFEIQHSLIEADPDISAHTLWLISWDIVQGKLKVKS